MKKRHAEILEFCKKYMLENGYPPSMRESAEGIGLKSTNTVWHYMKEMRENGTIISGPEFSSRAFRIPGMNYVYTGDDLTEGRK